MTPPTRGRWGRLYRLALRLLPANVAPDERDEMARTFDRLVATEPGRLARIRRAVHGLVGLLTVAALERWEARTTRAPESIRTRTSEGRTTMDRWTKDLRYALRTLRRTPAFSAGAVLLMAVGIGAVTAVFTLVDHVLLRPLPYPEAERLVALEQGSFPGPMVRRIDEVDAFETWAAAWSTAATLTGEGDPVRIEQARVTDDFFRLFGGGAVHGRLLAPDDGATADAVVLSHDFWQRQWGGDPGVVGRTLTVDDGSVAVVGVLDPAFAPPGVLVSGDVDIWRPVDWSDPRNAEHNYHVLDVVGRLRSGATPTDARAGILALTESLAELTSDYRERDGSPLDVPVTPLQEVTVRGVRTGLGLLLGAVGLLLAVACTNVAHLFLARGLGRSREMSVRRALGADTRTLTRQLAVESLVVGALGGGLGTLLAIGGLGVFRNAAPDLLPSGADVAIDLRILAFAAAVSVGTALVFGLLPALRSLGRDPAAGLRGSGRGMSSGRGLGAARSGMLVAEVALSMVLLAGSGLLMRSFLTVRAVDPGLDPEGVWSVPLTPTEVESPEDYIRIMESVRAAVAELPEVESAAYGLALPFSRTGSSRCCWSRGGPDVSEYEGEEVRLMVHPVSQSYFATLGIDLLEGTKWPVAESYAEPVPVVVTASTASELWGSPSRAPGQTFGDDDGVWFEVVGVVDDHRHFGLDQEMGTAAFVPMEILPFDIPLGEIALRVRGAEAPGDLGRRVREAIWSVAPALPVPTVRSMDEMIAASTATRRFDGVAFTAFGVLALLLAAGGLYGTLLYTVGQRRREMGIRIALGADRRTVESQVMVGGVALAAVGVAVGLAGAWFSGRLLESRLWGIAPGDPTSLAAAAATLLGVAALASWLPARRASRTDPVETLKAE